MPVQRPLQDEDSARHRRGHRGLRGKAGMVCLNLIRGPREMGETRGTLSLSVLTYTRVAAHAHVASADSL